MKPKVKLLTHTNNPVELIYSAIKQCVSANKADDIYQSMINGKVDSEQAIKLIRLVVDSGHDSVIEHVSFTFSISDVARITSQMFTRHRIASVSQQSQRYVSHKDDWEITIPDNIESNDYALYIFNKAVYDLRQACDKLREAGFKNDSVRYLYPNCLNTSFVYTMNVRSLINFFSLRLCETAHVEIRTVARIMLEQVREVLPVIFNYVDKPCVFGECKQNQKCKR